MHDEQLENLIRILRSDVEQLQDAKVLQKSKNEIVEWMSNDLNGAIRILNSVLKNKNQAPAK